MVIYNAPATEPVGGTTLTDYSPGNHNGFLFGSANIVEGANPKSGNCLYFPDGEGGVSVPENVLNTTANFTQTFWAKVPDGGPQTFEIIAIFGEEEEDRESALLEVTTETWNFFAIVHEGSDVRVYLNNELKATIQQFRPLLGVAVEQPDADGGECGIGYLYGVKIFNEALTYSNIVMTGIQTTPLVYTIDGVNFSEYGVFVSDSDGLLDRPKPKNTLSQDWPDENGTIINLRSARVGDREITLKCFIYASDKLTFSQRCNAFLSVFDRAGKHRLQVSIDETHPLVFDVYINNGVAVDKRWREGMMAGEFTLKLVEPAPVKKVIRFERQAGDETALTITAVQTNTDKAHLYTVSYGDGSEIEEFATATASLSHSYADPGVYYVIIAGVIDNLTVTTNGVVVWDKL